MQLLNKTSKPVGTRQRKAAASVAAPRPTAAPFVSRGQCAPGVSSVRSDAFEAAASLVRGAPLRAVAEADAAQAVDAMPSKEEIRGLFDKWNSALATLKPENVADLYSRDAVLLPTVSNKVRTSRAAILDYFKMFLTKKPQGVINESHVNIFDSTTAAHYGIYTFDLTMGDGSVVKVGARFSYTYRKENGKWLIMEHHSSALPEKGAPALPSEEEIRALFTKWNNALATLTPETVADCYASDAVLLPTVSNKVRASRSDIVDYFKLFLTKKPQGVINESYVNIFSEECAKHSGIYTFSLTNPDGSKVNVSARFSYTYRKENGKWLIVHHHSSALPETKPADNLPSAEEIRGLFAKWNNALATHNPSTVADLYAKEAVLLPTVSNQVRTNRAAIIDYFKMFLRKSPQGVIDESHVSVFGPTLAAHYGVYTFTLTMEDGSAVQVGARFSYTYRKEGNQWLIVEHHSSALPETKPPQEPLPSADEIRGLFGKWNAALATLKPENVQALYAPDAVLLPTVSNKVRASPAAVLDYFKMFLTKKPQGVINESHVNIFSPRMAAHYGIYTFDLTMDDGSVVQVGARFSYTYRKDGDKWLIVEHHSSALPEKPAPALPSGPEIRALFDKWNSALATLKPENVAALYAKDAVLLPTVSNQVRTSPDMIVDYFKLFLTKKPQGVINESHVTIFNPSLAQHTGIYTFDLTGADNTVSKVGARFSFTYRKDGDKWLIVEHHSSALPEPVPARSMAAAR